VITNNRVGISTTYESQHARDSVTYRAGAFGMPAVRVDGLSVDDSFACLSEAFEYVREHRRPFLVEAEVTRLYGHSSSSGAQREEGVEDPLERVPYAAEWRDEIVARLEEELERVKAEPPVTAESAETHVWADE
jgi:2-oxoisovalerate dehydrogenase E1 component alpha subunit